MSVRAANGCWAQRSPRADGGGEGSPRGTSSWKSRRDQGDIALPPRRAAAAPRAPSRPTTPRPADRARPAAPPRPRRRRRETRTGRPGPSPPHTQAGRARPRPLQLLTMATAAKYHAGRTATAQRPRRGAAPACGRACGLALVSHRGFLRGCASRGPANWRAQSIKHSGRGLPRRTVARQRAAVGSSHSIWESARAAKHVRSSGPAPHGAALHGAVCACDTAVAAAAAAAAAWLGRGRPWGPRSAAGCFSPGHCRAPATQRSRRAVRARAGATRRSAGHAPAAHGAALCWLRIPARQLGLPTTLWSCAHAHFAQARLSEVRMCSCEKLRRAERAQSRLKNDSLTDYRHSVHN